DERHFTAYVVGQHVQVVELPPRFSDVGAGEVHLVDGDDERHGGGAGVADGLLGLRHDAVVGGDDDNGDVGDVGAAGAHLGEGLVAGRVEKGDGPAAVLDAPGADHLRDAARLGGRHVALADLVQERGLAVVHVAHDGDVARGLSLQGIRAGLVGLLWPLEGVRDLLPAVVFGARAQVAGDAAFYGGAALAVLGAVGPLLVALVAAGDAAGADLALGGFGVFVFKLGRRDDLAAGGDFLQQIDRRTALQGLWRPGDRLLDDRRRRLLDVFE